MHYALLTAFTLIAFAANSLLCRMALGAHLIDPVSFATLRLASGAVMLFLLARLSGGPSSRAGSWLSGLALFVYALAFALAYVSLHAGIGALSEQQVDDLAGAAVAEQLAELLLVVGDAVRLDQGDEVLRPVAGERAATEGRVV